MYRNQAYKLTDAHYNVLGPKYDRGHLVPAATLSSTFEGYFSTFTYTNAVPQHKYFNTGPWNDFEGKIRKYASEKCIKSSGTLYLITGTSFTNRLGDNTLVIKTLLTKGGESDISIPNSLWTAGCCVLKNSYVESFAVIGDNVMNPNLRQITILDLQKILLADVTANDRQIGGPEVDLFPGNKVCSEITSTTSL